MVGGVSNLLSLRRRRRFWRRTMGTRLAAFRVPEPEWDTAMSKPINYNYSRRAEPAAKPASALKLALVGSAVLLVMTLVEMFFK